MTTTYYRIQQAERDPQALLDPQQQITHNWTAAADMRDCPGCSGTGEDHSDPSEVTECASCDGSGEIENARAGVSVCGSLDDLYAYIRISGAWPHDCVIVELAGTDSDDQPEDAAIGELLVHPTKILSVTEVTDDIIATIYQED